MGLRGGSGLKMAEVCVNKDLSQNEFVPALLFDVTVTLLYMFADHAKCEV